MAYAAWEHVAAELFRQNNGKRMCGALRWDEPRKIELSLSFFSVLTHWTSCFDHYTVVSHIIAPRPHCGFSCYCRHGWYTHQTSNIHDDSQPICLQSLSCCLRLGTKTASPSSWDVTVANSNYKHFPLFFWSATVLRKLWKRFHHWLLFWHARTWKNIAVTICIWGRADRVFQMKINHRFSSRLL